MDRAEELGVRPLQSFLVELRELLRPWPKGDAMRVIRTEFYFESDNLAPVKGITVPVVDVPRPFLGEMAFG